MSDEIKAGDTVVLYNDFGKRIEARVVTIFEEHGIKMYRLASADFSLTVTKKQIAEVHR